MFHSDNFENFNLESNSLATNVEAGNSFDIGTDVSRVMNEFEVTSGTFYHQLETAATQPGSNNGQPEGMTSTLNRPGPQSIFDSIKMLVGPENQKIFKKMRIGFIGLGPFGTAILHNLVKTHPCCSFVLFDRDPINFNFQQFYGEVASSPAEVVQKTDYIFTRFTGFDAFKEVFTGRNGIMTQETLTGKNFIEMSDLHEQECDYKMLEWQIINRGGKFLNVKVENDIIGVIHKNAKFEISGCFELYNDIFGTLECLTKTLTVNGVL